MVRVLGIKESFPLSFILLLFILHSARTTHLQGTFRTNQFFKFLSKFGFQKTDLHYEKETVGYIFGNVTERPSVPATGTAHYDVGLATLVVLNKEYFIEYYGNRTREDREEACKEMMRRVSEVAYHSSCYDEGTDLLRGIPCPKGGICPEEDSPGNLAPSSQFTYHIRDLSQPRFWYVSLVACYRNKTTCEWHHTPIDFEMDYDIWLVNGNPNSTRHNPLVYQFSFDKQNTLELYLVFFIVYLMVVPLQLYAVRRQRHPLTRLFTASLVLEWLGVSLNLVHELKFMLDGQGFPKVDISGDILDILSRTTFMLLLLLVAKGWAVTRQELTSPILLFSMWALYGLVNILLYVWNKTEVDVIEDIDEYQTWPGWLVLGLRCLIITWFLVELRSTMIYEHNHSKLNFFLHFGASALVWYSYLPVVALIALQIPPFWRYKLLLGITYSADCLAYCVMTHLLWPTRSEQYFLLADRGDHSDELDEFNEAPHVINSAGERLVPPSSWEPKPSLIT